MTEQTAPSGVMIGNRGSIRAQKPTKGSSEKSTHTTKTLRYKKQMEHRFTCMRLAPAGLQRRVEGFLWSAIWALFLLVGLFVVLVFSCWANGESWEFLLGRREFVGICVGPAGNPGYYCWADGNSWQFLLGQRECLGILVGPTEI